MAKLTINSILIVCTGNICRSPVAEQLLKKELHYINICSAGINAKEGKAADSIATSLFTKYGIKLKEHRAKQLNLEMLRSNDLILVMEELHIRYITSLLPECRGKVFYYGQWLEKKEIVDPYKKSTICYELVFKEIERASIEWTKKLNGK